MQYSIINLAYTFSPDNGEKIPELPQWVLVRALLAVAVLVPSQSIMQR